MSFLFWPSQFLPGWHLFHIFVWEVTSAEALLKWKWPNIYGTNKKTLSDRRKEEGQCLQGKQYCTVHPAPSEWNLQGPCLLSVEPKYNAKRHRSIKPDKKETETKRTKRRVYLQMYCLPIRICESSFWSKWNFGVLVPSPTHISLWFLVLPWMIPLGETSSYSNCLPALIFVLLVLKSHLNPIPSLFHIFKSCTA